MKKIIAFLMILTICFSFVGCVDKEKKLYERIEERIESKVRTEIALNYDNHGLPEVTHYIKKISDDTYSVTGDVIVKDKIGNSYTGQYDATAIYDSSDDEVEVKINSISTLYRD